MKRTLLALMSVLLTAMAMARPVDPVTARRVASVFLQAQGMRNTEALVDVTASTPFTAFYVFAAPDGGFALVSADDCALPLLGYSATSRFECKDMPSHVRGWLDGLEAEVKACAEGEAGSVVQSQWQQLKSGQMPPAPLLTAVSPLLTTQWNQSPYYNDLCPFDYSSYARSVTGCVATATAQVMKYWNHPATGYGSHSYDHSSYGTLSADFGSTTYSWSNMPNSLSGSSSSAQVNAVATLMYHVGVADEMNYSPSASGAQNYQYYGTVSASSQNSLVSYFKYRPDMAPISREDYSNSDYCTLLRNELDQNRPILYSGSNIAAGHSFVLDGYNTSGDFHINWGWGGYLDGYFVIGSLNPGVGGIGGNSSGTYNVDNVALLGIRPNQNWSTTATTSVTVTSTGNGSAYGSGTYTFGDTVTLSATANAGYRFDGWSDGSKFNPRQFVATGGSYTFTANFVSVTADTLTYCPGNHNISRYGDPSGNAVWGVKIPASVLPTGTPLAGVKLYVAEAGTYNLTVYVGSNHSTVAATASVTYYSNDVRQWQTIVLDTPVSTLEDLWIVFRCSDAQYPATYTYGSGYDGAFLWMDEMYQNGNAWGISAMIKGIFSGTAVIPVPSVTAVGPMQVGVSTNATFSATATAGASITWSFPDGTPATASGNNGTAKWATPGMHQAIATATNVAGSSSDTVEILVIDYGQGDTVSYCLDRPFWGNVGYSGTTYWGIMVPSRYLTERDTLKDVLLYADRIGNYTLNIHRNGNGAPGSLVYTKTFNVTTTGQYVHCTPDSAIVISKNKNLWITFSYPDVTYPAMGCEYVGEPNSDWISSDGSNWSHLRNVAPDLSVSWLIKAVTSKTVPIPTYTLTVNSADATMGSTYGTGTYNEGAQVDIRANAYAGYRFDHWQDGNTENPRYVTVTADATYTAYFVATQGIDEVDAAGIAVGVNGRTISVRSARPASFFDMQGRLLATGSEVTVDAAGVYLVCVGSIAHKVVVK